MLLSICAGNLLCVWASDLVLALQSSSFLGRQFSIRCRHARADKGDFAFHPAATKKVCFFVVTHFCVSTQPNLLTLGFAAPYPQLAQQRMTGTLYCEKVPIGSLRLNSCQPQRVSEPSEGHLTGQTSTSFDLPPQPAFPFSHLNNFPLSYIEAGLWTKSTANHASDGEKQVPKANETCFVPANDSSTTHFVRNEKYDTTGDHKVKGQGLFRYE
jgi:hypothetical protein